VTVRQQPSTANGTVFVSIEDEIGTVNVIVWKSVREEQRAVLLGASLLGVQGLAARRRGVAPHLAGTGGLDTAARAAGGGEPGFSLTGFA
jgi:error-prone DNA polymerase